MPRATEGRGRIADGSQTAYLRAVKVIGLGGIGTHVAQALAQFLSASRMNAPLVLVDGDTYEERNRDRVLFEDCANKALAKAHELGKAMSGRLVVLPVPQFVTPDNVDALLGNGETVFLAVDNHATRKLVGDRCANLRDVVLFSGGNDGVEVGRTGTFGNVQVYIRRRGHDITNPLGRFHPEIAHPVDKRPDELGCDALAESAPQLLFTNLTVAAAMLGAFHAWLGGTLDYEEVYLDIASGRANPVRRDRVDTRAGRPSVARSC